MRIFLIDNEESHIRVLESLLEDNDYISGLHAKFVNKLDRDFEDPQIITLQPDFKNIDENEIANYVDTFGKKHCFTVDDFYVVDTYLTDEEHNDEKIGKPLDSSSGYKFAKYLTDKLGIPSEMVCLISKFILLDATAAPFGKIMRKPFMVGRETLVLDRSELAALDDSLPEWLREYDIISDFKNQIYYRALKSIIEANPKKR